MNNKAIKRVSFDIGDGKRSSVSLDMELYELTVELNGEKEAMNKLKSWAIEAHKNNEQGAGRSTSRQIQKQAIKDAKDFIAKNVKKQKTKTIEPDEGMSM